MAPTASKYVQFASQELKLLSCEEQKFYEEDEVPGGV